MKTAYLDGTEINDKRALHTALAEQLDFPAWYGHNLDALYDLLTTERQEAVRIVILHRSALEERLGGYFRVFLRLLDDVASDDCDIRVEFPEASEDGAEQTGYSALS